MQSACAMLSSVACPAVKYFSTLSHTRHDFREKVTENQMCVLIFCITFVWKSSHSKKNWARYDKKYILFSTQNIRYSCKMLMKFEFSPKFLEKYSNFKFHESQSTGSRVVPYGQSYRHDEANTRFLQFFLMCLNIVAAFLQ